MAPAFVGDDSVAGGLDAKPPCTPLGVAEPFVAVPFLAPDLPFLALTGRFSPGSKTSRGRS